MIRISLFQDDLFEGKEKKNKMFEQLTPAHMREMLSSHDKLATVGFSDLSPVEFERSLLFRMK